MYRENHISYTIETNDRFLCTEYKFKTHARRGYGSRLACLPEGHEALPGATWTRSDAARCNPNTQKAEAGDPHPQLHSEQEANLGYKGTCS